jgi:probable rRNA maturation factor
MTYHVDIQNATEVALIISEDELISLASLALRDYQEEAELTLRIVSPDEMVYLNHSYRKINKVTNVLAFPSNLPDGVLLECPFLGDIIICPQVLEQESKDLNKSLQEHWTLIVIHGVLHLLGYDHIKDSDAEVMQSIEIKLLAELGFANPYDLEGNYRE